MPGRRKTQSRESGEQEKQQGPSGVRKFASAEELHARLEEYFASCDARGKLYSEQGMALHLGVTLSCLENWWRGVKCQDLQEEIQLAYLRIAEQIATDERYNDRNMVSLKIFLLKQQKYGGYQDRIEARQDLSVNIRMGSDMDASDFL